MANLNNEKRAIKLESASVALKKYFDYFQIDDSQKNIYDMLATGNNFIEPANLVEYAKIKGLDLVVSAFDEKEFMELKENVFPIIAVINDKEVEKYVIIKKTTNNSVVILENETGLEKKYTFDDFFEFSTSTYIVQKVKYGYLDFKNTFKKFVEINKEKDKLLSLILAEFFIYALVCIVSVLWLRNFKASGGINSLRYTIFIASFLTLGLQTSLNSQMNQSIRALSKGDFTINSFVLNVVLKSILCLIVIFTLFEYSLINFLFLLAVATISIFTALFFGKKANFVNMKAEFESEKYLKFIDKCNKNNYFDKSLEKEKQIRYKNYDDTKYEKDKQDYLLRTLMDFLILIIILISLMIFQSSLHKSNNILVLDFVLAIYYLLPFFIPFRDLIVKLFYKDKIERDNFLNLEIEKIENQLNELTFEKNLKIENLHYEFVYNKPILKNINVKISNGKKVLICGESGAGKTTLANLIIKNFEMQKGDISFDDISIKNLDLNKSSEEIFYISEDAIMFDATILENITMFEKISMKRVVYVCQKLGIHSAIQKKSFNYKTWFDYKNPVLSNVEIKKILIARAILKKPKFLIIDGFTDVFDESDVELINDLLNANENIKTVLMFSRNIPKNFKFDVIYELDNGMIKQKINIG